MRVWFAGGGTGGHLYPALGIARALVRIRPDIRPLFIGARRGIERDVLPESGFDYVLLELHPLYRSQPWLNARTFAGASGAWRTLRSLARRPGEAPVAIVATGGYAAGIALAFCASRRLPLVLQEQNSVPGLTTRFFSRYARQIHLGFPEAARFLHPHGRANVRDTGNPIEPPTGPTGSIERARARQQWGFAAKVEHVLLVFGGSQGARAINSAVNDWLLRGAAKPDGVGVLWITGRGEYETFASLETDSVRIRPFVSPMSSAYLAADLAVARAGAMSTAEMCAWGIPAVLVPLPTAAADHQTANARALEASGAAVVVVQRELNGQRLAAAVTALLGDSRRLEAMRRAAFARGRPGAAEAIARDVAGVLPAADDS